MDVVQRPSKSIMYEDIDTGVGILPLLSTTLYFQSNPRWLSHPSSPRHSTAFISPLITSIMGTIFDSSPVPASAGQDPSRLGPTLDSARRLHQIQAAYRVKNAGFTPRASIWRVRIKHLLNQALDLPVSSICGLRVKIQAAGSKNTTDLCYATPGQIKAAEGRTWIHPCQHLRLRVQDPMPPGGQRTLDSRCFFGTRWKSQTRLKCKS
jgi:hypothetical protein